jgi:hypothetical protein
VTIENKEKPTNQAIEIVQYKEGFGTPAAVFTAHPPGVLSASSFSLGASSRVQLVIAAQPTYEKGVVLSMNTLSSSGAAVHLEAEGGGQSTYSSMHLSTDASPPSTTPLSRVVSKEEVTNVLAGEGTTFSFDVVADTKTVSERPLNVSQLDLRCPGSERSCVEGGFKVTRGEAGDQDVIDLPTGSLLVLPRNAKVKVTSAFLSDGVWQPKSGEIELEISVTSKELYADLAKSENLAHTKWEALKISYRLALLVLAAALTGFSWYRGVVKYRRDEQRALADEEEKEDEEQRPKREFENDVI